MRGSAEVRIPHPAGEETRAEDDGPVRHPADEQRQPGATGLHHGPGGAEEIPGPADGLHEVVSRGGRRPGLHV